MNTNMSFEVRANLKNSDGSAYTPTGYSDGATMSNPLPTFGKVFVTVYDSTGAIASSNSVPINKTNCFYDLTNNQAYLTIVYGLATQGTYNVQVYREGQTAGAVPNLFVMAEQSIVVQPPVNTETT